jgi:hypothetical protein
MTNIIPIEPSTEEKMNEVLFAGKEVKVRLVEGGQVFTGKLNKAKNKIDFFPYIDEVSKARRDKQAEEVLNDVTKMFD